MRSGQIKMGESNISPKRRHAGPAVVWLTKNPDRDSGAHGLRHDPALQKLSDYWRIDKTRIRITVEVPNAHVTRYVTWAKSQGIDKAWLNRIMATRGSYSWFVSSRPVVHTDWIEIRDTQTDQQLWTPDPAPERHLSAKGRV